MLTKLDLLAPPHCHYANKKDICLKSSFVNKYMFQRRKMEYTIPELSFWKYLANPFYIYLFTFGLIVFFLFFYKNMNPDSKIGDQIGPKFYLQSQYKLMQAYDEAH